MIYVEKKDTGFEEISSWTFSEKCWKNSQTFLNIKIFFQEFFENFLELNPVHFKVILIHFKTPLGSSVLTFN